MSFAAAETERLLANLIRVGVVTALDAANARVQVRVGGLSTDWLPWITARAGATRTWSAPRTGEQVLVLSPYGDPAQGVVLPAIYQDDYPAPAASQDVEHVTFPDGSTVAYDSTSHQLTVNVGTGQVVVNCNSATVNAAASVTLDTPTTNCTGNLNVTGVTTTGGLVSTGTAGGASITGSVTVTGNVATTGTLTNNGKDVGSSHKHSGVQTGGGQTGAPV